MLGAAAGLDRAHIYMLRNVNDKGGGKFETCGLTSSKATQWQPKLSFYYTATILSLLGHTRFSKLNRGADDVYIAEFDSDSVELLRQGQASRVWVVWIGSQSNAKKQIAIPGLSPGSLPVTLVELVDNSTTGQQRALSAEMDGMISIHASEKPVLVLLGVSPSPISGPVPPIDAPVPFVCKRRDGSALGPGLFCNGNATSPSGHYHVCPSDAQKVCPNGGLCEQQGNDITCKPNPQSQCNGKATGLYCSTVAKPSPAWPDGYVECPGSQAFYCPTMSPHCVQNGTDVSCVQ